MRNEKRDPKPKSSAKSRKPLPINDQLEVIDDTAVTDRTKGKSGTFLRSLGKWILVLTLIFVLLAVSLCIWIIIRIQSGDIPGFFKDGLQIVPPTTPDIKVF
jgi:hypothetical protein